MDSERSSQNAPPPVELLTRPVSPGTVRITLAVCIAVSVGLASGDVLTIGRAMEECRVSEAFRRAVDAEFRFQVGLADAVRQGVSPEGFASSFGEIRPRTVPTFRPGRKPYTHAYADPPGNRTYYLRFADGKLAAWQREPGRQPPAENID